MGGEAAGASEQKRARGGSRMTGERRDRYLELHAALRRETEPVSAGYGRGAAGGHEEPQCDKEDASY